ncbi:I78 family peptidase inhibitor [Fodinicurvata sp. EGI_FJ10296]|uniref:I78 family peptidase inhibitor n=1 Tax=Fodinicurvata sp. EGI_FJ10296 TaxID=3231908 RepID=UPI0034520521
MIRLFSTASLATTILLAGCISTPVTDPPPREPIATNCDARSAAWSVGLTATDEIIDRAWEDANARFMRVIRPNKAVTMEFNPERINFELDRNEVIRAVRCG